MENTTLVRFGASTLAGAAALLCCAAPAAADFLGVPAMYPTIQQAIDAAPDGAVILVAPGVYAENLDFGGKEVTVQGSGPDSVIDGGDAGSVVRFVGGEGPLAVLDSFTIRGGLAATGGGIEIRDSSPTILRNVIVGNRATGVGSGIYVGGTTAEPAIFNNLLAFNTGVGGGDPHTIQVVSSSPRIVNNTIARNDSNAILTSGIASPEIRNNILVRNGSRLVGSRKGRGICDFATGTETRFNLFYRNTVAALLTGGVDYRRIRRAQNLLLLDRLADNLDGAPRYTGGRLPRTIEEFAPERFLPSRDPSRRSRAVGAGDPAPEYDNLDGTRNTIGFTGGPYALFTD